MSRGKSVVWNCCCMILRDLDGVLSAMNVPSYRIRTCHMITSTHSHDHEILSQATHHPHVPIVCCDVGRCDIQAMQLVCNELIVPLVALVNERRLEPTCPRVEDMSFAQLAQEIQNLLNYALP
eukprot:4848582-Amphidinium_carterae.1